MMASCVDPAVMLSFLRPFATVSRFYIVKAYGGAVCQRTNRSGAIDYIVRVLGALRAPHMSIGDITKEVKSFIEVSAVDP